RVDTTAHSAARLENRDVQTGVCQSTCCRQPRQSGAYHQSRLHGTPFFSWTRYVRTRERSFPLDIAKEHASLLWTSQRRLGGTNEIRSPSRHSRPHDSQSARRSRAAPWLWNRETS